MKLVFLGPPGSGKGTYASRIEDKRGWPQISTGQLLRDCRGDPEYGKTIIEYQDSGKLVPDEIVMAVLKKRLSQDDCKNGFILDGFPRSLDQVEELEKITKIDLVINLVVPEEIVIFRLSNRRQCRKCAEIFSVASEAVKPKVEGVCDKCGGELYQRDDDKPEVIKKRLDTYHQNTAPLIDYYRNKGIIADVECKSAESPPEVTVEKIEAALDSLTQQ